MVTGNLFHSKRNSWPPEEYVSRNTLQLFNFDSAAPPKQAWRRRLNSHANILKEFSVTFMEAIQMVRLGIRLWSYVREEASHGRKAPIDPFTRESCKPSASQGVPLGGMGSGSISRGFRGEFRQWQIVPGTCNISPVMANQFSVKLCPSTYLLVRIWPVPPDKGLPKKKKKIAQEMLNQNFFFLLIFISRDGGNKKYASVLAPGQHEGLGKTSDEGISSWGWNLNGQHSTYHALFPRAWTYMMKSLFFLESCFEQSVTFSGEPDPDLKVSCRQISPFVPHDYRDSSLPTAVFVYTLVNTGKERAKVSLLFTWANSIGGISHLSGDHVNEPFMTAKGNPPVTFAVAASETQNVNVTVLPCFGLTEGSFITARKMWGKMMQNRENFNIGPSMPSSPGRDIVYCSFSLCLVEPYGKCTIAFALAWSSPKIKFSKGSSYHRRYTNSMAHLKERLLQAGKKRLRNGKALSSRYKLPEWKKVNEMKLGDGDGGQGQGQGINSLCLMSSTSWLPVELFWIDSSSPSADVKSDQDPPIKVESKNIKVTEAEMNCRHSTGFEHTSTSGCNGSTGVEWQFNYSQKKRSSKHFSHHLKTEDQLDGNEDVGRFLYLEGVEYIMWCTYDVHFYASFALLELFPKIELNIQRDFAKAVLSEDGRKGNYGIRKVRGAVPHDLGTHDPWNEMNAYNIHDTSKWKDLNSKFVLQVYRDFAATGDMAFGIEVWPAVRTAMEYMEQFDRDDDGLIENDGFPDQTYDAWTVHGVSAYCGCLWLAALQAAAAMAQRLGDKFFAETCKTKFFSAKSAFEKKLWNGSYFTTMTVGLVVIVSRYKQTNWQDNGTHHLQAWVPSLMSSKQELRRQDGCCKRMHPKGKVDESCMQSREIWTGVTYAVAANMLLAGMEEEAFTTAEGIFIAGWSEEGFGYWFQTPEGWTIDGHYRSLIYMRPLAIWSMQWALSPPKAIIEAPKINMMDRIVISPATFSLSLPETRVRKIANKTACFGNSSLQCTC
ncbi:hypothetical protein CXB51_025842 [Gossypium anomalum]|uniref:NLGase n=1 Tax=Gossypium anomalum TaxID=47600 RepID=A0A8J5YKU5_9ROSI|nr:hypothetical protein CXB51_025842 [Gossypium anomalum]